MNLIALAESGRLPDGLIRLGIRQLLRQRLKGEAVNRLETGFERYRHFLTQLRASVIAEETDAANKQHYEVPAVFYKHVLGPKLKYSSALFDSSSDDLGLAETAMLEIYAERAELANGQRILELGCGWGSLTLWMAEKYPDSRITALSNSASQKQFIDQQASVRGIDNIEVVTCDINEFKSEELFDRVLSIEMFEHVRNYAELLSKVADWLNQDGRLFIHIFCHRTLMYPFETEGDGNWMGRHFFTGGQMPAFDTLLNFQNHVVLDDRWAVSGTHYQATSEAWLANLDKHRNTLESIISQDMTRAECRLFLQRWRMFFMACAELFGYNNGNEWHVGHYRFRRR